MSHRGSNEGSIRKRPDGRWEARLTISGKQRSVYGTTREAVVRKMRAAMERQDKGLPIEGHRVTVGQFLDRWLVDCVKPTVRPKTFRSYEMQVRVHLRPTIGKVPLTKLTPQQVQKLQNDLMAQGSSPSSAQYTRAVLRRALGQALKWGLVARNVVSLVDPPKVERPEIRPMTPEQARQLLSSLRTSGDRLLALYVLALATGMRQGELLGLRWEDVDLDRGTVRIRHALQWVDGSARLVEPKTERSRRTLPIPDLVVRRMREHQERQHQERHAVGSAWKESGFVFTSVIGTPLDGCNVTKRFQRALEAAGLPKQRFHDLRHSCASFLLAEGMSPRVVMETLGHSQISITMDTYAHVMPAQQREAADKMGALLASED